MLYTNLEHIETAAGYRQIIGRYDNVMICCGRMEYSSIVAFDAMEKLQAQFRHVAFFDLEFDNPQTALVRDTHGCRNKEELPYILYLKKGELQHKTAGAQTKDEMANQLAIHLGATESDKH